MSSNYEHYYNITFLDDLHNYFPDILYADNNRFSSVNDLLEYIRSQTRNQFDLFSSARRNRTRNNNVPQIQGRNIGNQIQFTFNTEDIIESPNSPLAPIINDDINTLLGPLTNIVNLLYPASTTTNRNFLEPVVVRPTQQHITNNTTLVELSNNTQVCVICQETMVDGNIRKINHCRHTFHDACIRQHFENNVRCPICRFDIRNTV